MNLVKDILAGKPIALARMISMVEECDPEAFKIMTQLYESCGRAQIVGITGPPGIGKSCLINALIKQFRENKLKVGVLAVDPSSVFTGGAILGDRARMLDFASDPEVFIRSLATRGTMGGLSEAINGAIDVLDAAGKDIILIETVGVGQNEIDISNIAHTVVLVLGPGYGDGLQAIKAGIMEVCDILVVNKADQPGIENTVSDLLMLPGKISAEDVLSKLNFDFNHWSVPVARTTAIKDEGINALAELISMHLQFIKNSDQLLEKTRKRRFNQTLDLFSKHIRNEFLRLYPTDPLLEGVVGEILALKVPPTQAIERVLELFLTTWQKDKGNKKK